MPSRAYNGSDTRHLDPNPPASLHATHHLTPPRRHTQDYFRFPRLDNITKAHHVSNQLTFWHLEAIHSPYREIPESLPIGLQLVHRKLVATIIVFLKELTEQQMGLARTRHDLKWLQYNIDVFLSRVARHLNPDQTIYLPSPPVSDSLQTGPGLDPLRPAIAQLQQHLQERLGCGLLPSFSELMESIGGVCHGQVWSVDGVQEGVVKCGRVGCGGQGRHDMMECGCLGGRFGSV